MTHFSGQKRHAAASCLRFDAAKHEKRETMTIWKSSNIFYLVTAGLISLLALFVVLRYL